MINIGSKALLHADITGAPGILRGSGGSNVFLPDNILVRSNTSWKFEIDAAEQAWFHIENYGDEVNGDGVLRFTYDPFVPDSGLIMTFRTVAVRIVSSKGHILNSIMITQNDFVNSLRFSTDAAGSSLFPDQVVSQGTGDQTMVFYVYSNSPDNAQWRIDMLDLATDPWLSVDVQVGTVTTKITLTIKRNYELNLRRKTLYLGYVDANRLLDQIVIVQYPYSDLVVGAVRCSPGDWDVDMSFEEIKLNGMNDNSIRSFTPANQTKSWWLKRSNNVNVYKEELTINMDGNATMIGTTDPDGNSNLIVGKESEIDVDSGYRAAAYDNNNWMFSPIISHGNLIADTVMLPKTMTAYYSRHVLEEGMSHTAKMSVTVSTSLIPTDYSLKIYSQAKQYDGTGLSEISLHNVYDHAHATPTKTTAQWKYDKFNGGEDAQGNNVKTYSGVTFKPDSQPAPGTVAATKMWSIVDRGAVFNSLFANVGVVRVGEKISTVSVYTSRESKADVAEMHDVTTGKKTLREYMTYPVESLGYYTGWDDRDGHHAQPADGIAGVVNNVDRKRTVSNEYATALFNIDYIDNATAETPRGPKRRISMRYDFDRKQKFENFLIILEAAILIIVGVLLIFLSGGAALGPVFEALLGIGLVVIMVIKMTKLIVDLVNEIEDLLRYLANGLGGVYASLAVLTSDMWSAHDITEFLTPEWSKLLYGGYKSSGKGMNEVISKTLANSGRAYLTALQGVGYIVEGVYLLTTVGPRKQPDFLDTYVCGTLISVRYLNP